MSGKCLSFSCSGYFVSIDVFDNGVSNDQCSFLSTTGAWESSYSLLLELTSSLRNEKRFVFEPYEV